MPDRRISRGAVSLALLVPVIGSVLWMSDPQAVMSALSKVVLSSVVLALMLLLTGVALSSLRLRLITADLGYPLSFRDAAMTLSVGQLAGTAFFQFAGQLIGRSAVLSRKGIPAAATVVISGYERAVALSVSLLLAGGGALYLFGTLSLNLEAGGLSLIKLALGLAAVTVTGAAFAWGNSVLGFMRKITRELLFGLLRSFIISLAIQGTTLAAYVAIGMALAPHAGIASLAAASCIVMLAASLPVSFGGWGLRELSAVVALQAIGLSVASALLIALLIGFLSLAVVAGTAVALLLRAQPDASPRAGTSQVAVPDYALALDWCLPLMAATAVFFQIYVPTGDGRISVNLADPVVMLGAGLFIVHYAGGGAPVWRVPRLGIWIASGSAVLLLSMLYGLASFGWSDWAWINRGVGWLVVLCYGMTGALVVHRAQARGFDVLLRTFIASGAAIALIDVGAAVLAQVRVDVGSFIGVRISGLSQNPNAFAFMLLLMLSAAIALQARSAVRIAAMTIALVGLWFAASRAGFLAVPIVLGAALFMGAAFRPLLMSVICAAAVIAGIAGFGALIELAPCVGWACRAHSVAGAGNVMLLLQQTETASTQQHLATVQEGLAIFLAHPIFGAGLGAYVDGYVRATGTPLVIHSTPVWLLAETGIVGFAVFAAGACRLLACAVRYRGDPASSLLLLILCTMAVMSSVHEMMYQRGFWLLLGAALAMPVTVSIRARRRDHGHLPAHATV